MEGGGGALEKQDILPSFYEGGKAGGGRAAMNIYTPLINCDYAFAS